MKAWAKLTLGVVPLLLASAGAATADPVLHYVFDAGSHYDLAGLGGNVVTGSFDYDADDNTLSNVNYTRGDVMFDVGGVGPGDDQLYFGVYGSPDYDVYQFAAPLANGGTDIIVTGFHPDIVTEAGGSVSTMAAVPEPATWALMLVGVGAAGWVMRRQRVTVRVARTA